jgi:hypothetical protein
MNEKLEYYGGDGYGAVKEEGVFEVKATETKTFTSLSKAREYYDSLIDDKALWDITSLPELLEAHTVVS